MSLPSRSRFLPALILALVLWAVFLPAWAAPPQPDTGLRYPADMAWRLVTEDEIQEFTGCPQSLGREEKEAPPLFEPPTTPLGGLPVEPDKEVVIIRPGTQWDVAPFPSVDPPAPAHLPPEARARWEENQRRTGGPAAAFAGVAADPAGAPVFGDVGAGARSRPPSFAEVGTRVREAPSALLRPRAAYSSEHLVRPETELPVPFTLRRYHTEDLGFFQIAVYGGSSGFAAERAYRTLRAAAPNREAVSGVGEEAFMALVLRDEPAPAVKKAPAAEPSPSPDPSPAADGPAFGDVAVVGRARPELVDPGLAKARSAPSFQGIPVDLAPPPAAVHKKEAPPAREAPPSTEEAEEPDPLEKGIAEPFGGRVEAGRKGTQVLVAFFPSKGVVVELALDDRIGDSQSLIRLAFLVQGRLLQRW